MSQSNFSLSSCVTYDLTDAQVTILEVLTKKPKRSPEIARLSGYKDQTVRKHLPTLARLGFVIKTRRGYVIADSLGQLKA